MTLAAWLAARDPQPPERLARRLQEIVGDAADGDGGATVAEQLVHASGAVLETLVREGQTTRDSALELLAADALATYAFEAQCDAPGALDARCQWAMAYLSRLADRV